MEINAQMVKALRDKTGIGFNKCREALTSCEGDVDKAVEFLRKKGLETAAKKSSRDAKDGLVRIAVNAKNTTGAILEVNCESDFVARTEAFQGYTETLIKQLLESNDMGSVTTQESDNKIGAFLESKYSGDESHTVESMLKATIAQIGENMLMRRLARFDLSGQAGYVGSYSHMGGKIGVLVELHCGKPETGGNADLHQLAKDLCMQVAASNPICLSRDDMPADAVGKEREIYREQVKGKPDNVIDKIVEGKLNKLFYADKCLLEQPFVKEPKTKVKALVDEKSKALGDEIKVVRFARYELGAE